MITSMHQGSTGNLILDKLENIGGNYVKALKVWRENFIRNFDTRIKPEFVGMSEVDIKIFLRKWEVLFFLAFSSVKMGLIEG